MATSPGTVRKPRIGKRRRRRAKGAAAHLAAIVQSAADAIISTTLDGTIPSLSTSGEMLTVEESMNLEGENGATPGCWSRAQMEAGPRMTLPPAAKTREA